MKSLFAMFVLLVIGCGRVDFPGPGYTEDGGVPDSEIPDDTDSGVQDGGNDPSKVTCWVTKDVYMEPGVDPKNTWDGYPDALSCSKVEVPPPASIHDISNMDVYRCVLPCPVVQETN